MAEGNFICPYCHGRAKLDAHQVVIEIISDRAESWLTVVDRLSRLPDADQWADQRDRISKIVENLADQLSAWGADKTARALRLRLEVIKDSAP